MQEGRGTGAKRVARSIWRSYWTLLRSEIRLETLGLYRSGWKHHPDRQRSRAGAFYPDVEKVLEATILHELVHWCRWAIGKDVFDEGPPYAFEKEAYGQVMERTWNICFDEEFYVVEPSKGK